MFIDRVKISIKAGDGGNGAASFHREKYVPNGGPDGGDGGKGGNVIFVAVKDKNNLIDFHFKKKFVATNGVNGQGDFCNGKCGQDIIIEVPCGTVIKDDATGNIIADMYYDGQKKIVLSGGNGGKGNCRFKNSRRQSPSFSQLGEKVEIRQVLLELKTIADVGLVGLPNAGKSTLLSKSTGAKPKIASYHFTTLTPNLGVVKYYDDSFVIADIPGLIEGASDGAGLGHNFLRHIERTRMIAHVIDMSGLEGNDPYDSFVTINSELKKYSTTLYEKKQIVVCNKMDCESSVENLKKFKSKISKDIRCFEISALTGAGIDELLKAIMQILTTLEKSTPIEYEEFVYEKEDITKYEIMRHNDGAYEIYGPFVKYLGRNVNLDDVDSFNYFQKMLRQNSVIARLKEMGINEGDVVVMGEIEFEFME